MSEQNESSAEEPVYRCPTCDSVVAADAERCLMCGAVQPERPLSITQDPVVLDPEPEIEPEVEETAVSQPAIVLSEITQEDEIKPEPVFEEDPTDAFQEKQESVESEQLEQENLPEEDSEPESPPVFVHVEDPEYAQDDEVEPVVSVGLSEQPTPKKPKVKASSWVYGITAVVIILVVLFGILTMGPPDETTANTDALIAAFPSSTSTFTPQPSPSPVDTELPPAPPTATLMPESTKTLEPPRQHIISSGDTLFGLALQYRISLESILETNEMTQNSAIIAGQPLLIPWPTPTPDLEPVGMEFNGELVIADPFDCRRYEIVSGDSLNAISARADIDYDLFLLVNRLNDDSVIQPGDTVCLPEIVYGATLPPTAGPSPTPSNTPEPPGPNLLYPVQEAVIEPPDGLITLQWAAVGDLAPEEWYMIEITDMDVLDAAPWRGFTRDNAFQVPSSWRPILEEPHQMRWRVSLVNVTGFREDGLPLYTYGGQSSDDAFFTWKGAIPTPTPTATSTATATSIPVTPTPES